MIKKYKLANTKSCPITYQHEVDSKTNQLAKQENICKGAGILCGNFGGNLIIASAADQSFAEIETNHVVEEENQCQIETVCANSAVNILDVASSDRSDWRSS